MTSSVSSTVGWSFEIGLAPPPNHRQSYLSPVVCITQQRSHNQDFKDPRKKAVWGPHAGIMCVLCEGILCARVCMFGCTCLNEHAFRACIRGVVRVRVRLRNVLALEYFTAYSGVCMRICVWWCVLVIQCKRVVVWYTRMACIPEPAERKEQAG